LDGSIGPVWKALLGKPPWVKSFYVFLCKQKRVRGSPFRKLRTALPAPFFLRVSFG
jgi:hypothetical protein